MKRYSLVTLFDDKYDGLKVYVGENLYSSLPTLQQHIVEIASQLLRTDEVDVSVLDEPDFSGSCTIEIKVEDSIDFLLSFHVTEHNI